MSPSEPLAPIVLFCYNRPAHLRQTLEYLQANALAAESELYIYSDGPKKESDRAAIAEIHVYLSELKGFKKINITQSETNLGLAASVIKGVSQVISQYRKVIVLEDDMLTTPDFLDYMNEALNVYSSRSDIFSVTAYTPPISVPKNYKHDVYLAPRASSWGWGTWVDKWRKADWNATNLTDSKDVAQARATLEKGGSDLWPMLVKQQRGVIDSWAIRWTYTQSQHQAFGLYPVHSKIKNIGTDGSGTNFTFKSGDYGQEMNTGTVEMRHDLKPDEHVIRHFREYYDLPFSVKIKNWVKYRI
ncbi:glycosyltransferase [Dyadobacter aurulentus]|uniref:glycosyltransferase n=1 Tax=Dyadobacter sp. UC 10 TaxID=2605428 RepID=UPI0011F3C5F1|nr:glycosyltransferase [Dyadobacter sp. UC 10]KAA0989661.1 glycosyltransferase [Dyadobacter sp. UC 10]